jgi:hypothetical protein
MASKTLLLKKIFLFCGIFCFSIILSSRAADTKNAHPAKKYVVGKVTWMEWQKTAGWETYNADDYNPDPQKVKTISRLIKKRNGTFMVFGASWCGDSKSEMPKIFKLFSLAGISAQEVALYGLDLKKQEPSGTSEAYDIKRVATLVVLAGEVEIGRIVEYPALSWEDDLMAILTDE